MSTVRVVDDLDAVAAVVGRRSSPQRRVVLVPVAGFDRRAVAALKYAQAVPAAGHLAIHVVEDTTTADELELSWLVSGIDLPLELLHSDRGVAGSVAEAADECLRSGADEVVVVLARQVLRRRWHRMLHDRTADAIAAAVAAERNVLTPVVTVPVESPATFRRHRTTSDRSNRVSANGAHRPAPKVAERPFSS